MLKLWKTEKWDCSLGMDCVRSERLHLANYNIFDVIENVSRDICIKVSDRRLSQSNILKRISKEKRITTVKDVNKRDFSVDMQELPLVLPLVSHSCLSYWHKGNRARDIQNIFPSQGTLILALLSGNSTHVFLVSLIQQPKITKEMYYLCFFGFYHALLDEIRRCSDSMHPSDGVDVLTVEAECFHILVENSVTLYEDEPAFDPITKILLSNMGIRDICIHGGNDVVLDVVADHMKALPKLRKVYFIGELLDIAGWVAVAKIIDQMNVKNLVLSQRSDMLDRGWDVVYHEKVVQAASFILEPKIDKFWGALSSEYLRYESEFQEIVCKKKHIRREKLLQLIEKSKFFIKENYLKLTGIMKDDISCETTNLEYTTLADLPGDVINVITSMLTLDDVEVKNT